MTAVTELWDGLRRRENELCYYFGGGRRPADEKLGKTEAVFEVYGRPIIIHTLEKFEACLDIDSM